LKELIKIKGARENNLKNVDVEIPRNQMVVFTGVSGSGKTSLAFDTIYAEGQRRYMESLSSYARQFLGQMEKPDVDYIEGLSPAISIDQKTTNHNPRSTVGTVTEIYDYLRLLYARVGTPHCPQCGKEILQQTVDQIADKVMGMTGKRIQILAPLVRGRKGEHKKLLETMRKNGYVRVRIDGEVIDLAEEIAMEKNKKHSIEVVVDRLIVKEGMKRLTESIETAASLSGGLVIIDVIDGEEHLFSQNYSCPDCDISIEELTPRAFSFNNPFGACQTCTGLGFLMKVEEDLVIPDQSKSLNQGAIQVAGWNTSHPDSMAGMYLRALARHYGFSLDTPVQDLPEGILQKIFYGTGGEKINVVYERAFGNGEFSAAFEGIIKNLERRYRETTSAYVKAELETYYGNRPCPDCRGARLKPESRAVTVGGLPIHQLTGLTISETLEFIKNLQLGEMQAKIAARILKEIQDRLGFLENVGLTYLTLSRAAGTLSGGEAQRIRLATQVGSGLVGVLYILDEPSIGLHQRDNGRLLTTLKKLRDLGNTLIVVEHDEETIRNADYVVDVGPKAGVHGGEIVAVGTPEEIERNLDSLTGQYLSGRKSIEVPQERKQGNGSFLTIYGAAENNLKAVDVSFPLGLITCVTGVSGSGKSSLVNGILYKVLSRDLNRSRQRPGEFDSIEGEEHLDKVIAIDQSPIGRTPRSNPATYTGLFDLVREVFALTPAAKAKGYKNGRFSFNVKGGRCEACKGDGIIKIEMHFLPDIYVPCEVCKGKRYNRETLEVTYKGRNIYEVLEMTVDEALEFFAPLPRLARKLQTMQDVGLGYLKLGHSSTLLSGGEAQRVKLATELSKRSTGRTMYILDEPTTGLHTADVDRLIRILQRLREGGNSVVVIEHNLDVIKTADYIIDLGPEGGSGGGEVVAAGTPEQVVKVAGSFTGQYLGKLLN
jgi:excinuclease ABC subunit A